MRYELLNLNPINKPKAKAASFPFFGLAMITTLFLLTISSGHARLLNDADATSTKHLDSSLVSMGQQATFAELEFLQGVKAYKDKDFYRAERIWLPLARNGHRKAQFFLGVLYDSASNDRYKAVHWYLRAAERGDSDAQHNLGLAYARGLGVKKNIPEAIKWGRSAGLKGNSDSQYNLGIIYATGAKGVNQNFKEAKRWWLLAAASGDALAQYNLGAMYANGVAGKQSYCEAVRWWSRSQSNGFRQADIALENLVNHVDVLKCK